MSDHDGHALDDDELEIDELELVLKEDIPSIRKVHRFYQVMAWIVGVLLVALTLIGMPLKYIPDAGSSLAETGSMIVRYVGVAHGWLYAILLVSVVLLGLRVKWSWKWFVGIALAGTVPFLSFDAEHKATTDVRTRIQKIEARGI